MNQPATATDIVGKTIARILQTEWEHLDIFSGCNFYLEFTDGTMIALGFDSVTRIDGGDRMSLKLHDLEIDPDFPALWSSDGTTGVGNVIEKVISNSYGDIYLVLSGGYYMNAELGEGQDGIEVKDRKAFLYDARIFEFFDLWTKEPFITNNMRAIDVIVESSVDDLNLWQSRELFLTIGRVQGGVVSDLLCVPNNSHDTGWKARFVVPEPGTYQMRVQRRQGEFVTEVDINESVIRRGHVTVRVV